MHVAQQACSGVKHEFVVASQDIGSTSPSTHELLCEENELFFVHATSSTQPSCTTSSSPPEGKVQDGLAKDMLKGHERAILKEVLDCVTKTAVIHKHLQSSGTMAFLKHTQKKKQLIAMRIYPKSCTPRQ